jgi:RimJ/RimL family protein N-acetyltransferase
MRINIFLIASQLFLLANTHAVTLKKNVDLVEIESFETERLLLTPLRNDKEEAKELLALCVESIEDNYMEFLFDSRIPLTKELIVDYILNNIEDNATSIEEFYNQNNSRSLSSMFYLIKDKYSGAIMGTFEIAGSDSHLGIFIGKKYAAHGYAREVVRGSLQMLQEKTLEKCAHWECFQENSGSIKTAIACDFQFLRNSVNKDNFVKLHYVYNFRNQKPTKWKILKKTAQRFLIGPLPQ